MTKIIEIISSGNYNAKPNIMEMKIDISAIATTSYSASEMLNHATSSIKQSILNIISIEIFSNNFSLRKKEEYDNNKHKNILVGYEANHSLKIKNSIDFKLLDSILFAINKLNIIGVTISYSVDFSINDKSDANKQAYKKAISNCYEIASAIADSSGIKLGKIVNITNIEDSSLPRARAFMCDSANTMSAGINPSEIEIVKSVKIQYEID